ncbi:hypothetical protein AX660_01190 [Paraglaciecola hydrolytica]|uniref:Uncharacterized protein n=1 Tax=Paraglaciecola hydrolytica TaxID=1799789 RepID=A0A148KLR1_9ALTE|nr:hypothetical protein AX660_01190 [Paraglaciecola hydrolytica]
MQKKIEKTATPPTPEGASAAQFSHLCRQDKGRGQLLGDIVGIYFGALSLFNRMSERMRTSLNGKLKLTD